MAGAISMSVAVVNESTVLSDAEVEAALPALQHQANYHFALHYHTGARLHFFPKGSTVPGTMAKIVVADDTDQADALGYHDADEDSPEAIIFAGTDIHYGLSWTVTFSHELLELLADPWVNGLFQVTDTQLYAAEVCDAVEADEDGYVVKLRTHAPVAVSNFVLPAWFRPGFQADRYDWRGLTEAPLEIRPGGYMSLLDLKVGGWTAIYNRDTKLERVELPKQDGFRRPRPSQDMRRLGRRPLDG